jgi:pilus assembly protein CpaB
MNGKAVAMLVLAVICGLGAMYGTTKLISRDKGTPVVEMQDVLVAVRDLKVEEMLKPDVVKVERMAKTAVPAGAFSSAKDLEQRWVTIGILQGEPIVEKKLAPRGSPPGLVSRIPKGMRAYAIEVNEQTGVSGFVLPDHRIDVVQMIAGIGNSPPEAETVLEDVLVLAAGQTFTRPDTADRSIQARTVTLAVTPEQVDTLVAARSRGALTLSLRGLNDHQQAAKKKPEKENEKPPVPEPKPELVAEKLPEPAILPPPPPPEPKPAPAPVVQAEPPKPARYLTVYKGLDNVRRVRLDTPDDTAPEELAAAAPETSSPPKN